MSMFKVFVIGGGIQGRDVIKRLLEFDWIEIAGLSEQGPESPAAELAKKEKIPVFTEYPVTLLQNQEVDLVFNLSKDAQVRRQLHDIPKRSFEIATGEVTQLLSKVIHELEAREARVMKRLGEHRLLLDISIELSRSETPDQMFEAIVSGITRLTGMPAGSLSVYNAEKEELYLVSVKGLSSSFYQNAVYPVRPGGLTDHILNQKVPVFVPDIAETPDFCNPVILREGICSLIAVPLIAEKGPIGILYSDDFRPSHFASSLEESITLLATQSVIAIQKQQAFEKIKDLSIRDPLTGIYNRRYLKKVLTSEIGRATRLKHPLSIILLDIDFFKQINDRFGHLAGDHALEQLSRCFEAIIRPYDVLARFGGEEFIILMSETDEEKVFASAERLREAAEAESALPDDTSLTCSFGVSTYRAEQEKSLSPKAFIHQADLALYRAKREGRNRVCRYETIVKA